MALTGPVTQLRIRSACGRRHRWVSAIPDPGGDLVVVAQLERGASGRGSELAGAQLRLCSTVGKCDDTQAAARGDRCADRPQVRCVRETRALEVRCSWPQYTSESHSNGGRQPTIAARVTDDEAMMGRPARPVEHRMHLRGFVAPR